ncbi:MAG: outer membrane protein assembly factor BamA [Candidatus Cloacimonetes bacterium]|nr:outer membrane protein assembly factor BamA [Candidatus Cloacimonadota bacterium]
MQLLKRMIILLLISLFVSLYAQNFVILDVHVEGNQRINRDLILATSGLRIGDNFTPDLVSHAIRALYNLSVFDDVTITVEEIYRGLRLNIMVVELPVVNNVRYVGNKAISNNRMDEMSIIRVGTYWSPIVQFENTRRLLSEYSSRGHHIVDIDYVIRETDAGLDIRINIEEGRRLVVRGINIEGNQGIETNRILKTMKGTRIRGLFRSGRWEEEKFREDLDSIIQLYNTQGFLDARIVHTEEIIEDNRNVTLNIIIEEGERFLFGSISVSGNQHFETSEILALFTQREGDVFNMETFNNQMRMVASMYFEEGYIYLHLDPHISRVSATNESEETDLSQNIDTHGRVNIHIDIVENTRSRIHKIHVVGNTRTREKVIRRQLVIAPGDYFRQTRVIRSQQNVYNLGFFGTDMDVDYMPINNAGDVDLYLSVSDVNRGSINGGAGFNSRDKLVLQASVAHNNLMGKNWQGNLSFEYARSTQNVDMMFTNPHLFDTDVLFGFNVYHTQRDWTDFNYRIFTSGGGVRLGYPIKALDFARIIGGYSLYSKQYEIRNPDRPTSPELQRLHDEGRQYTSAVTLTLIRDSRDNIFFPTSGSRIWINNELAGGPLGGDFNYYKQVTEVSWFTPVFLNTVLRLKWRYGYLTDYGRSANGAPPDERFFLGGTGPDGVRGYSDRSIGTSEGDGGSRMVLFSTELGIPLSSDAIIGLLFFDSGEAANRFADFNFRDLRKGAGTGIRLRSPIGLLGFDYAYNFEYKRWEPHFQLGTTF